MPKNPLFSPYRGGENRVTSSMLAVFERMDVGLLEWLLRTVVLEETLSLVSFTNQVTGQGARTVPDALIAGSFKLLFEIKTVRNAPLAVQCADHLAHLDGSNKYERLFVITPDAVKPAELTALNDLRVGWFSFRDLHDAIDTLLVDSVLNDVTETVPEYIRFLLRELQAMFLTDGLLDVKDVLIVAAGVAYPDYLRLADDRGHSSYACQPQRSFREGIKYLGFYSEGQIQIHVPEILARRDVVELTREEAARLRSSPDELDRHFAQQIELRLAADPNANGALNEMLILSAPNDTRTRKLTMPIRNTKLSTSGKRVAWTQGQARYISSGVLGRVPAIATTDDLDALD